MNAPTTRTGAAIADHAETGAAAVEGAAPIDGWRFRLRAVANRIENERELADAVFASGAFVRMLDDLADELPDIFPSSPLLDTIEMGQDYLNAASYRADADGVKSVLRSLSGEMEGLWQDISKVRRERELMEKSAGAAIVAEGADDA